MGWRHSASGIMHACMQAGRQAAACVRWAGGQGVRQHAVCARAARSWAAAAAYCRRIDGSVQADLVLVALWADAAALGLLLLLVLLLRGLLGAGAGGAVAGADLGPAGISSLALLQPPTGRQGASRGDPSQSTGSPACAARRPCPPQSGPRVPAAPGPRTGCKTAGTPRRACQQQRRAEQAAHTPHAPSFSACHRRRRRRRRRWRCRPLQCPAQQTRHPTHPTPSSSAPAPRKPGFLGSVVGWRARGHCPCGGRWRCLPLCC